MDFLGIRQKKCYFYDFRNTLELPKNKYFDEICKTVTKYHPNLQKK